MTASYPQGNTTNKSISVRLGQTAAYNFDTDPLRVSAGWTGKFLTATGVTFDTQHGGHPHVAGAIQFGTSPGPGWADAQGRFDDPRPIPYGPIPEPWARWEGLFTVGDDVVLAYRIHGTSIKEWNHVIARPDGAVFVRTLSMAPFSKSLTTRLFDLEGSVAEPGTGLVRAFQDKRGITQVAVVGAPSGSALGEDAAGRVTLQLQPSRKAVEIAVLVSFRGDGAALEPALSELERSVPPFPKVAAGGRAHWPTPIVTQGVLGTTSGPYVVDRITTPFPGRYADAPPDWKDNPFHRRIMLAGLDFFKDGTRAAVSTWEGDVWIVSGITSKLERITWRRFASGLYEPLGLAIVNDVIYVTGRDQITRLIDLNGDGEADHYENFNNQVTNSPGFHEFQFDLQTDAQGNFYTAKAGPVKAGGRGFGGGGGNGVVTPMAGALHKISCDGKTRTVIATGLRAPNGIGVGPRGELTTGDNEGTWVPACPINWVTPGAFMGVVDTAGRTPNPPVTKPLAWLPKAYDNSGGGQVWVTSDRWGSLKGELLHLSYGRASIYRVLKEKVGEQWQGGVVRLVGGNDTAQTTGEPVRLTSSAMRGRFNRKDGQLYVVGLSGWQSDAVSLTGFDRIRYTGKVLPSLAGLKVTSAGVQLSFDQRLDPTSVTAQNFAGERWNYRRTKDYGSPEFSVEEPERRGHDRLTFRAASLSKDGRTVTLQVEDLRPVDQQLIKFKLKSERGESIAQTLVHTIHVVPLNAGAPALVAGATRPKAGLQLTLESGGHVTETGSTPGVQLFVGRGRAPGTLTPPGPFRARWDGTLAADLPGDYVLATEASGPITVRVGGAVALDARAPGLTRSAPVSLTGLATPVEVVFTSDAVADAYARLSWAVADPTKAGHEGLEPIPSTAYKHEPTPAMRDGARVRLGRQLFVDLLCVRCHANGTPKGAAPDLEADVPRLDGIGSRLHESWMKNWVQSPTPGRGMPRVLPPDAEADLTAIGAYLATLKDPADEARHAALAGAISGRVQRERAEGSPVSDRLFKKYLCAACHSEAPQSADDGRVGLAGVGTKYKRGALAAYLLDPQAHYAWNRMPHFRLSQEEAVELEIYLARLAYDHQEPPTKGTPPMVARGKELVLTSGCTSCHDLTGKTGRPRQGMDLFAGGGTDRPNCVAGTSGIDFRLGDFEKDLLKEFLASDRRAVFNHAPAAWFAEQAKALRCTSCHGVFEGFPALEGLGEKLEGPWVTQFLAGRVPYKPRGERHPDGHPWLEARMPAFPARAALLAEGMAAAAGLSASPSAKQGPADEAHKRAGAQLVSAAGGFSCVACHAVGPRAATQVFEAEGINLADAGERLRPAYFRRWLRNPLRLDPQTKMPAYFDDTGSSPLELLGADRERQIDAMWAFVKSLSYLRN